MTMIRQAPHTVNPDATPDLSDGLRDLGEWLITLSAVTDRMPKIQYVELLKATRGLRRDLHAIRLSVPGTEPTR